MAESKHGVAKYSTALLLVAIGVLAYGLASSTDLRAQETHPGFVPKDLEVYGVQGYDHHAVLVYQYHLEFYDLPEDIVVGHEPEHPNNPPLLFKKGKREFIRDIPSLGLKPMKVMRFQHRIKFPSIAAHEDRNFIWACEEWNSGYNGSDPDEMQRLRDKYPDSNGWMPWVDKTAEYADFCGAISPEGEIIYRLPVKQHFPDTVYQVWQTNTAGTSIYLKVGSVYTKTVVDDGNLVDATPGEKIQVWGKCRQNLIYTFPDKLESFGPNDLDKFKNAMKAAGYTAFHSKCSARE